MKQAIEKLTEKPSETSAGSTDGVNHTHVYRVDNAKRAMLKVEEKLKETDCEWTEFKTAIKLKFDLQREAYCKSRAELVQSLFEIMLYFSWASACGFF